MKLTLRRMSFSVLVSAGVGPMLVLRLPPLPPPKEDVAASTVADEVVRLSAAAEDEDEPAVDPGKSALEEETDFAREEETGGGGCERSRALALEGSWRARTLVRDLDGKIGGFVEVEVGWEVVCAAGFGLEADEREREGVGRTASDGGGGTRGSALRWKERTSFGWVAAKLDRKKAGHLVSW